MRGTRCPTCGTPNELQPDRESILVTYDTVERDDVVFLNAYPYKPMVVVTKHHSDKVLWLASYNDGKEVTKIYSEKEFNEKEYFKGG